MLPETVSAQGLVACEGLNCDFCSITETVQNIIEFIILMMVLIAVLILAYAGFKLVTSAGNTGALEDGKKLATNVVIGIVIVLAAWTIVDTVIKALAGGDLGVWNQVDCGNIFEPLEVGQYEGREYEDPDVGYSTSTPGVTGPGISLPMTGNLVTYQGHQFDSAIVSKIEYLDQNFDLRVTGGYRTPERNSAVNGSATSYHLTGRAGDFVGPQSAMEAGRQWARASGARETLIHNAGSGTHLHVAW